MCAVMNRAYSVLEVRSVDTERREIEGWATTPTPDRMGDVIEPLGAKFTNPVTMLLYHDSRQPVGFVKLKKPTERGIEFSAQIADVQEPGRLRDRVEEAWQSVKSKLIRGVSIGFRPFEDGIEFDKKTGSFRFTKYEIVELSLVSVPANQDAVIEVIRSCDAPHRAAIGEAMEQWQKRSGVADTSRRPSTTPRSSMAKKTTAEQIASYEATRAANAARMKELMDSAGEKGETLGAAESEEFDRLDTENKSLDTHLTRLKALQPEIIASAVPVSGTTQADASASRGGHVQVIARQTLPPGIEFARAILCRVVSFKQQGSVTPLQVAKEWYPDNPRVHLFFEQGHRMVTRAASPVPAATTTDPTWAGTLVDPANIVAEFMEYLRPQTIVGKFGTNGIPPLMRVPFNVRINGQTSGGNAYWVGQGKAKPLTKFDFAPQTLLWAKVAAISVITEETARFSSPSAEQLVRDGLTAAIVERMDIDFIDPAKAAVSGVSPASITNGVTPITSSGNTADDVRKDIQALVNSYVATNQNVGSLVLIMPNTLALALSMMRNSLGQSEFGGLSVGGGTIEGLPVIASQYAAQLGNLVIAVNASSVGLADDGQVTVDVSREASLEMSDAPAGDSGTGAGAALVSMFQTNSIALRAERFVNWAKFRAGAVQYIDGAAWGGVGSP